MLGAHGWWTFSSFFFKSPFKCPILCERSEWLCDESADDDSEWVTDREDLELLAFGKLGKVIFFLASLYHKPFVECNNLVFNFDESIDFSDVYNLSNLSKVIK